MSASQRNNINANDSRMIIRTQYNKFDSEMYTIHVKLHIKEYIYSHNTMFMLMAENEKNGPKITYDEILEKYVKRRKAEKKRNYRKIAIRI